MHVEKIAFIHYACLSTVCSSWSEGKLKERHSGGCGDLLHSGSVHPEVPGRGGGCDPKEAGSSRVEGSQADHRAGTGNR